MKENQQEEARCLEEVKKLPGSFLVVFFFFETMNSVSRISWFSLEECFQGLEQHVIKAAFTVVYGPKFVPAFQRNSQAYCELEVYMNPTKVKYHMQEKFLVSQ